MDITQAAQKLASDLKQHECYARNVGHDTVAFFDPKTLKLRACPYDLPTLLMAFELGLLERRNIMTTGRGAHSEVIEVYAPHHSSL
jgi:hypothetical protein